MDIKRELQVESALRKDTKLYGPNALVIIGLSFSYLFSFIPCIIYIEDTAIRALLLLYLSFSALSVDAYMEPSLYVVEAGKRMWIFSNYRYAPTTPKRLFYTKELILLKFCLKHAILSQIAQFLSFFLFRLAYHNQFHLINLLPFGIYLLIFVFETLQIGYHAFIAK